MTKRDALDVVLERNPDGWYTASVPAPPGCVSQGATAAEARTNIREAIGLYFDAFGGPSDDVAARPVLIRDGP